jgi:hypothetical protein
MASVATIQDQSDPALKAPDKARSEAIANTIRVLFAELPVEQQDRLLTELTEILRPIPAPKAGDVLGAIIRFLPRKREWTVDDVKKNVDATGVSASPKEIYNALGYLTRKGRIQKAGYGRYIVDGLVFITEDPLGGEPTRHEIDDT